MLCKRFGAAMVYTEFVSAEALVRSIKSTVSKLTISDEERPVGIQIYGRTTEDMVEAAKIVEQAKPDVIDINFGCPVKKVAGKGAGAGMLRNIPLMLDITREVVKAVNVPVTVKTRLGWDCENLIITDLAEQLQDCGIQRSPSTAEPVARCTPEKRLEPHRRGEEQSPHPYSYHRQRRHYDPGRSQACLRKIRRRCGDDWPRHLRQAMDFQGNS